VGRLYSQNGFAKVCHSIALVLAGWYLMAPPVTRKPNGIYEAVLDGPFRQWKKQGPYETMNDCAQAKEALSRAAELKAKENDTESIASQLSAYSAQCVGTDDPRLKGK